MTNIIIDTSDPPASGEGEKKLYQVKKDPSKAQPFPPRYVPPHRLRPQAQSCRLRRSEVPYGFITTDKMLVKGLDHHLPSGLLKPVPNEEEDVNFSNVRYGGSYTWNVPVMRNQLRSDHQALGEKSFTTPAIPDVLGDLAGAGVVETDVRAGLVDYIVDTKDAAFLRPTFNPFETIFHSLPTPSLLDGLDIIADQSVHIMIVKFLQNPARDIIRIDCQYTPKAVLMQYWMHEIFYGAGEPHRGYVCNFTRGITTREEGEWEGGTTQVVRYDWGGMGMLVRYPVNAMLAGDGDDAMGAGSDDATARTSGSLREGPITKYTFDTKNNTISKSEIDLKASPTAIDRSRFIDIKVYGTRKIDLPSLYLQLMTTQTKYCLLAPHVKGDFGTLGTPRLVTIDDPIFDSARVLLEPYFKKAIGMLRSMVRITRDHRANISFVGRKDGSMVAVPMSDQGQHQLSQKASDMLEDAKTSALQSEMGGEIIGYARYFHDGTGLVPPEGLFDIGPNEKM